MRKTYSIAFFSLALIATTFAQDKDSLVLVYGKMLRAQDSTPISGSIRYEKLPYYDDMGIASVGADGNFELQLVYSQRYNLNVSKPGYLKYENSLDVTGKETFNIYVEEDIVELIKLEALNFVTNSDRIVSGSYQELDDLALWMNDNPTIVIQLEGHTDFGGNAEAAMRLSQARVESVKTYLVSKDVKKNRILTKAFGGTQPLVEEGTREERAVNRRVEVRVIRR